VIHHVPERFGEGIGSPAEFVGVVETIAQQAHERVRAGQGRDEGFVVFDGAADPANLFPRYREVIQDFRGFTGPDNGVPRLFAADIVHQTGQMAEHHPAFTLGRGGCRTIGFDADQGGTIQTHPSAVAEPVAEIVVQQRFDQFPQQQHQGMIVIELAGGGGIGLEALVEFRLTMPRCDPSGFILKSVDFIVHGVSEQLWAST